MKRRQSTLKLSKLRSPRCHTPSVLTLRSQEMIKIWASSKEITKLSQSKEPLRQIEPLIDPFKIWDPRKIQVGGKVSWKRSLNKTHPSSQSESKELSKFKLLSKFRSKGTKARWVCKASGATNNHQNRWSPTFSQARWSLTLSQATAWKLLSSEPSIKRIRQKKDPSFKSDLKNCFRMTLWYSLKESWRLTRATRRLPSCQNWHRTSWTTQGSTNLQLTWTWTPHRTATSKTRSTGRRTRLTELKITPSMSLSSTWGQKWSKTKASRTQSSDKVTRTNRTDQEIGTWAMNLWGPLIAIPLIPTSLTASRTQY